MTFLIHPLSRLAFALLIAASPAIGLAQDAEKSKPEADGSALFIEPPNFDLARLCVAPPKLPKPKKDWSGFDGKLPASAEEALAAARWFGEEENGRPRDAALSARLLEALNVKGRPANPAAQLELARLLLKPEASAEDKKRGVMLLETAVRTGSPNAALVLGRLYERGQPVKRDPEMARRYFQIAAVSGEVDGQVGLARLAKSGLLKGVSAGDADRMARAAMSGLLGKIAAGDCGTFATIGFAYRTGILAPRNEPLALRWLEKAALSGHGAAAETVSAAYRLGQALPQSDKKALEFMKLAAGAGRPKAMSDLGAMLMRGDGVPRDRVLATLWLEKAAAAGRNEALKLLLDGWSGRFGDPADPVRAFPYLKALAELPKPDPEIVVAAAKAYRDGLGTAKDPKAAMAILDRAAKSGAPAAAAMLAAMVLDRNSDHFDASRAARLYRMAALGGNATALAALSDMHACGLGVPFSVDLARRYEERAAFAGSNAKMMDYIERIEPGDTPRARAMRYKVLRAAAIEGKRGPMVEVMLMTAAGYGTLKSETVAAKWKALAFAPGDSLGEAHLALARALVEGRLVEKNLSEAKLHLEQAIVLGQPEARHALAQLLKALGSSPEQILAEFDQSQKQGNETSLRAIANALPPGMRFDGRDAAAWMKAAAEAGDVMARINLAKALPGDLREAAFDRIVARGICEPEEMIAAAQTYADIASETALPKARLLIERLLALDVPDADITFRLADALMKGILGAEGTAKGETLLNRASEQGHPKALALLADRAVAGSLDEKRATDLLQRSAAAGDMKAAMRLVRLLATQGEGAAAELERLRISLEKAAQQRPEAARLRGKLAIDGAFGAQEALNAHLWFEQAALAGDTPAMRELANLHLFGIGVEASPKKAFAWQLKAADAGDIKAAREVSMAYETGMGVPADPELARKWARKAAPGAVTPEQKTP